MLQLTTPSGNPILVNPEHIQTIFPSANGSTIKMALSNFEVAESLDAIIEQLAHEYTLQDVSKALDDIANRL